MAAVNEFLTQGLSIGMLNYGDLSVMRLSVILTS